ncbi:MAG: hypothetical protein JW881_15445 [Spirochaetales bacterium]|nr:hypothetical protein [Spirochaetales bacterium]
MKRPCFILILTLWAVSFLSANVVSYMPGAWGTLTPFRQYDLAMTYEKIVIDAYLGADNFNPDDPLPPIPYLYLEYRCTYRYKNTGKRSNFWLGFPVRYGYYLFYGLKPSNPLFTECRITVDGKKVPYGKYIHGINSELQMIDYDEVYGFEAEIGKGEEKTIDVFYTNIVYFRESVDTESSVQYILKSAHALTAPIGRADIDIRFHFTDKVLNVPESPGAYTVKSSAGPPYTVFSWDLKDFIPENDIRIDFSDFSFNEKKKGRPGGYFEENLKEEQSIGAYCEYIYMVAEKSCPAFGFFNSEIEKKSSWGESGLNKNMVDNALRDYYSRKLADPSLSNLFTGFILGDIRKNPGRSPSGNLVDKAYARLERETNEEYKRETDKMNRIISALKNNPMQERLIRKASLLLRASPFSGFILDRDGGFQFRNEYLMKLFALYNQKKFESLLADQRQALETAFGKTFDAMLLCECENTKEITDFSMMDNIQVNITDIYLDYLVALTNLVWNKKADTGEIRKLEKILLSLHDVLQKGTLTTIFSEASNDLSSILYILLFEKRSLLRRAHYALANYYFINGHFEKAISHYRTGIADCVTSPLFDYLTIEGSAAGSLLLWVEDDSWTSSGNYFDTYNRETRYRATRSLMNGSPPFWTLLPDPYSYTPQDIIGLYTPERLLSLRLEKWEHEREADAPCYYFAYNTACAYSRLKKGKMALLWLEVALGMKPSLSILMMKDGDLEYLREAYGEEMKKLVE